MENKFITIKGARVNNLKNIDLRLPLGKMIVITGVSGSGKSSLAFDTLYAEGQRRYVESLSAYARQFLGRMSKPECDYIKGLPPAIAVEQKVNTRNPRSTVGTSTEIYDYLRMLFARIGRTYSPVTGLEVRKHGIEDIIRTVLSYPEGTRAAILVDITLPEGRSFADQLRIYAKEGYSRLEKDGDFLDITEVAGKEPELNDGYRLLIDRISVSSDKDTVSRLTDSLETAYFEGHDEAIIKIWGTDGPHEHRFSKRFMADGIEFREPSDLMFNFNNPYGACEKCTGLGVYKKIDPDLIIANPDLSIMEGAVKASGWSTTDDNSIAMMYFKGVAQHYGCSVKDPLSKWSDEAVHALLYGTGDIKLKLHRTTAYGGGIYYQPFEGIVNNLERRYRESNSEWSKADIEQYMSEENCPECHGKRLKKEILSVTVGGKNIAEVTDMSVVQCYDFFDKLTLTERESFIAERIVKEIKDRLGFLKSVGLEYLTLSRSAGTLSGGESQRIRLATQIGSSLVGVLYILDEPSIGLHQRDNDKLIATLKRLRDLGNTLIVVEHDEDTMRAADFIVDVGPYAGVHGGEIICAGTVQDVMNCERSITGAYLSGRRKVPVPETRRAGSGKLLTVHGAKENNLKGIDVSIPLGTFTCVTGVSGSGKSSLVNQIIYKYLAAKLNRARTRPGAFDSIEGDEYLDKIIAIDQSPIGRTPRSNPATYTGVFNDIRDLFAETNDAKMHGYTSGRFSFNVKGGRCEACEGDGIIKIEMHFLPDVYVPCEVCKGKRYNRETLEVKYKGKNIYDVLEMTVDEGVEFFSNHPKIYRKLLTLQEVGLGYVKIGQPATTLSGGEAQRVKLAAELSKRSTGKTIYVLDEPTTGLHTADVHKLLEVLERLTDGGNTVLVIEHNLDVIKTADYLIDLGPEGGDKGGTLVCCGTPEEVAACDKSYTGRYLKPMLSK